VQREKRRRGIVGPRSEIREDVRTPRVDGRKLRDVEHMVVDDDPVGLLCELRRGD